MTFVFHPESENEFYEAIDYYEEREKGLGLDFAGEVYSAIDRAVKNPYLWPVIAEDIRRCQTFRFPYGILYSIEKDFRKRV